MRIRLLKYKHNDLNYIVKVLQNKTFSHLNGYSIQDIQIKNGKIEIDLTIEPYLNTINDLSWVYYFVMDLSNRYYTLLSKSIASPETYKQDGIEYVVMIPLSSQSDNAAFEVITCAPFVLNSKKNFDPKYFVSGIITCFFSYQILCDVVVNQFIRILTDNFFEIYEILY